MAAGHLRRAVQAGERGILPTGSRGAIKSGDPCRCWRGSSAQGAGTKGCSTLPEPGGGGGDRAAGRGDDERRRWAGRSRRWEAPSDRWGRRRRALAARAAVPSGRRSSGSWGCRGAFASSSRTRWRRCSPRRDRHDGAEKVTLTAEKETLLITLCARAGESRLPDSLLHDEQAARAVERIDYDFSRLKVDRNLMIGVSLRAHIFDGWTREFLATPPAGDGAAPGRAGSTAGCSASTRGRGALVRRRLPGGDRAAPRGCIPTRNGLYDDPRRR